MEKATYVDSDLVVCGVNRQSKTKQTVTELVKGQILTTW